MSYDPILASDIRALQRERRIERDGKLLKKLNEILNNVRLSVLDIASNTDKTEYIHSFPENREAIYDTLIFDIITGVRKMFPDCHIRTAVYNGKNYDDVDPQPKKAYSIIISWF